MFPQKLPETANIIPHVKEQKSNMGTVHSGVYFTYYLVPLGEMLGLLGISTKLSTHIMPLRGIFNFPDISNANTQAKSRNGRNNRFT